MSDTEPSDVVGNWIFNTDRGMGLGKAVDRRTVTNMKGDTRDVFVCVGPDGDETLRDVEKVLKDVNEYGYDLYEEHPWGDN